MTDTPTSMLEVPTEICGITAMSIAMVLDGQWQKRPAEKDTEHVKRIWKVMAEYAVLEPRFARIPIEGKTTEAEIPGEDSHE